MEDTAIPLDDEDVNGIVGGRQHTVVPMYRRSPDQARGGEVPTGPQHTVGIPHSPQQNAGELEEVMKGFAQENPIPK